MHTLIHGFKCVCIHSCIHGYMNTYIHTYIHIHIYIHSYIHTYIHTHTFMHTFIYTYIYTHKHAYKDNHYVRIRYHYTPLTVAEGAYHIAHDVWQFVEPLQAENVLVVRISCNSVQFK